MAVLLLVFGINYLKGAGPPAEAQHLPRGLQRHLRCQFVHAAVLRGLKVGQVVNTELMPDGSGRIALSIQVDEDRLRIKDSRIRIYSADIFTRAVSLEPATPRNGATGDTLLEMPSSASPSR